MDFNDRVSENPIPTKKNHRSTIKPPRRNRKNHGSRKRRDNGMIILTPFMILPVISIGVLIFITRNKSTRSKPKTIFLGLLAWIIAMLVIISITQ